MKGSIRKLRYWWRLLTAFWRKRKKLIIGGAIISFLFFLFSPRLLNYLLPKNTQKIGVVGRFSQEELPTEIQRLISDGLTSIMPDGEATPSLASSWEVKEEGKEYLFTLKDDASWQNGKPVLAKDINYNFNDVTYGVIEEKKIKFQLKEPFVPFPIVVSRPIFMKGLIGTGEYQVKSMSKNGQIVEKMVLIPARDKSKPILVYHFYPTESAARTAFKLGEVQTLKEISNPGELETWQGVKVTSKIKFDRFIAIYFDTQSQHFGNKSLRQALAYAIQKNWEPRAFGSINPNSWAYNADVKPYNYDLENAKTLLKKAAEENGEALQSVELSTIPSLLSLAEEIKNDWQELGIEVKIKIINSLGESFDALLVAQEIPPDPDQYSLWHSTQVSNISHYKSPKLDKLLEDGRKTLDKEKRKEIYADFQRFLVEDTPAIFLFHPTLYTVSRD